jgi:hypothetical protein
MNLQNTSKNASDEEGLDHKQENFIDNPLIRREVALKESIFFLRAEF